MSKYTRGGRLPYSAEALPSTVLGKGLFVIPGGGHLRYVSFLRPPHVRDFVREGYFSVPRYEVWGSKSPYNPRNIRGSDAE